MHRPCHAHLTISTAAVLEQQRAETLALVDDIMIIGSDLVM